MKRKNTQLFVFTVLLVASMVSVIYLSKASVVTDMIGSDSALEYEVETEVVEFDSPDVTVVQVLWNAAQRFFVIKE